MVTGGTDRDGQKRNRAWGIFPHQLSHFDIAQPYGKRPGEGKTYWILNFLILARRVLRSMPRMPAVWLLFP